MLLFVQRTPQYQVPGNGLAPGITKKPVRAFAMQKLKHQIPQHSAFWLYGSPLEHPHLTQLILT